MGVVAVRAAGLDDVPGIAAVHLQSWRETYRKDDGIAEIPDGPWPLSWSPGGVIE